MQFVIKMITITIGTWKDYLNHPGRSSVWLEAANIVDIKSTHTSTYTKSEMLLKRRTGLVETETII